MKLFIVINTYNRPKELQALLDSIDKEGKGYDIKVLLFNDGSTIGYNGLSSSLNIDYRIHTFNHGKINYWQLVTLGFQEIERTDCDYYFMLPDDIILCKDFFKKSIKTWEGIKDNKKICLTLNLIKHRMGKSCWTGILPIKIYKHNVYVTQWIDMLFMAEKKFYKALQYRINPISSARWSKNPILGSGVGQQISHRLYRNYNLYQVMSSLIKNNNAEQSMMNPEARKKALPTQHYE